MNLPANCCGGAHGRSCGGEIIQPACSHEIRVQRQMVADLIVGMADSPPRIGEFGPLYPMYDSTTGESITMGQMFDRYAVTLLVCMEHGLL